MTDCREIRTRLFVLTLCDVTMCVTLERGGMFYWAPLESNLFINWKLSPLWVCCVFFVSLRLTAPGSPRMRNYLKKHYSLIINTAGFKGFVVVRGGLVTCQWMFLLDTRWESLHLWSIFYTLEAVIWRDEYRKLAINSLVTFFLFIT